MLKGYFTKHRLGPIMVGEEFVNMYLGHGGELTLDDSPLGGLRVIMKLPV